MQLKLSYTSILIVVISSVSQADDCAYNRNAAQKFEAACAEGDAFACSQRTTVQAMAAKACDGSETNSRSPGSGATNGNASSGMAAKQGRLQEEKEAVIARYEGESCSYFTRPSVESEDGVARLNYYANGSNVCFEGVMFVCTAGRWIVRGDCQTFSDWEKHRAEVLERN